MVSIIVPVYNAEEHLRRCVDSILVQTFSDFELLLIDDGSKDGSAAICDEYTIKDSRVRVFHKENGGVSSARNLGLDNAQGEWIAFVDSDDFIPVRSLSYLVDNQNEDLIIGGYKKHYDNSIINLNWENPVIKANEFGEFLTHYIDSDLFMVPWCKLFKNEIINRTELRFNTSLVLGEDTCFVISYLLRCSSIRISDRYCYNYYSIGDAYKDKYKKQANAIIRFCDEITVLYEKLYRLYSVEIPNSVFGSLFDIIKRSYDECIISTDTFAYFLSNKHVRIAIKDRESFHIRVLLFLSKKTRIGIYVYSQLVKCIKSLNPKSR